MLLHVEVAPSHKLTYFHAPDSKSGVDKFAPFFPHVVHLNPLKDCNCIRMSKHCNPVERAIGNIQMSVLEKTCPCPSDLTLIT